MPRQVDAQVERRQALALVRTGAGDGKRFPTVAPHPLQHPRAKHFIRRARRRPLVDDDAVLLEEIDVGLHPFEALDLECRCLRRRRRGCDRRRALIRQRRKFGEAGPDGVQRRARALQSFFDIRH
jgi:hypothetical protein